MPQMSAVAAHFRTRHERDARIAMFADRRIAKGPIKARPAAAGVKFIFTRKKRLPGDHVYVQSRRALRRGSREIDAIAKQEW